MKKIAYLNSITGIIIIWAILLLACFGTVSGAEFDNVRSYNPDTKTVTFENWFGLGGKISEVQLKTQLVEYVPRGYQKVAEFEVTSYTNYEEIIKGFQLYDRKNGWATDTRHIDVKKKITKIIELEDYITECKKVFNIKNNTEQDECNLVRNGTITRNVTDWIIFDNNVKDGEVVTLGLFTEVKKGDIIEWMPYIYSNEKLEYWATWSESLNVGLMGFYKMNETTGDVIDSTQQFPMTASGNALRGVAGKINGSIHQDGALDYIINNTMANFGDNYVGNISFSMWIKADVVSGDDGIFYAGGSFAGAFATFEVELGTSKLNARFPGNFQRQIPYTNTTSWKHIVFVYGGTNATTRFYLEGVEVEGVAYNSFPASTTMDFLANPKIVLGAYYSDQYIFNGSIDEVGIWNRSLTASEITDLFNEYNGLTYGITTISSFSVSLLSPDDNNINNTNTAMFNCSATSNVYNITNISLYGNWSGGWHRNMSITGLNVNYTSKNFTLNISDGKYLWNCEAGNNDGNVTFASANRTITIDTITPNISKIGNVTNLATNTFPINSTWWFNATDVNIQKCYYNTSDNSTIYIFTCNQEVLKTAWYSNGTKTLYLFANDTAGNLRSNTTTLNISLYNITHYPDKYFTSDGDRVEFTAIVEYPSILTLYPEAYANLTFNSISYSPDVIDKTNSNYFIFKKNLTIPDGTGNATGKPVYFNWSYYITTGMSGISDVKNITVFNMTISDCQLSNGYVILNFTIKDEELTTVLNNNAPNSTTIELDLNVTSFYNSSMTWSFSKIWLSNKSVQVCVPNGTLNGSSYKIDFTAGYDATDHVREFYYMENGTLDNSSYFNSYTNKYISLYDLLTADSTTFLFTYTDADDYEVDDIIVHTYRYYIGEGLFREVERSRQDDNGETHLHLVEEDVIYYFMITQAGVILFQSDQYNAKCLSSPCEISLSASSSDTNWSVIDNEGGKYSITSNKNARTVTLTFNLESSGLVNMSLYKFVNGNYSILSSNSLTATAGTITLNVPLTYGNTTHIVTIYRDGEFVKYELIDFIESGKSYFGTTGVILSSLLVLTMLLMAVSEGALIILFLFVTLFFIWTLKLMDLNWIAIISIICAGALIVWKLVSRRNRQV